MTKKARPYPSEVLHRKSPTRTFQAPNLLQIAMPLGGIGAGCVCFNGHGGLQDFSIRNRPSTTAAPDGHFSTGGTAAILHVKGKATVTKLLEGPFPVEKIYDQSLQGQGYRKTGFEGLPRFENCTFKGEYPFGEVQLRDAEVPLLVDITAWSPFIPRDDINSGLPCAILEYRFTNRSRRTIEFEFSFHATNLALGAQGLAKSATIPGGVLFSNSEQPLAENCGTAAIAAIGHKAALKAAWFPGGWFDSVSALWCEVSEARFAPNKGVADPATMPAQGGSLLVAASVALGETVTIPVVLAWHFPNVYQTYGAASEPGALATGCPPADCCPPGECCPSPSGPLWRPFYVSQWKDAAAVAAYVRKNYASLRARTLAFKTALFSSTLPSYVLDAVSANLATLKSPTVLRQENGNMWGWEGCFTTHGSCHGSCTHVWNYAQALPHLFPQLERTLREQEYLRSMDERGHINFRSALPDGPAPHTYHAASDGQLGGIMKLYRDWHIGGDSLWLARLYPLAKASLDYCTATWDPDHLGALIEPHHNTYDIEFWGPDGMCSSIYLGALAAAAAMAAELGQTGDAEFYADLAARGAAYLDANVFNGEYYEQKIMWRELKDQSFADMVTKVTRKSDEVSQLLKREGPKYQYGSGCLSDGVIGAWMAKIYGIDTPQNVSKVRKTLEAIFAYNFRDDLFDHACLQRPGYALGHEPGLLLCSWPRGGKPTLPFVYSDEVWTGIEYQVASHLIAEGMVEEGLTIVKAARDRYDGRVRNPWNEYECGSYYARAMASYALLQSLSGFRYSAVTKILWLEPQLAAKKFVTFFSTASGFGTITLTSKSLTIEVAEGQLHVAELRLTQNGQERAIQWKAVAKPGAPAALNLRS